MTPMDFLGSDDLDEQRARAKGHGGTRSKTLGLNRDYLVILRAPLVYEAWFSFPRTRLRPSRARS